MLLARTISGQVVSSAVPAASTFALAALGPFEVALAITLCSLSAGAYEHNVYGGSTREQDAQVRLLFSPPQGLFTEVLGAVLGSVLLLPFPCDTCYKFWAKGAHANHTFREALSYRLSALASKVL